MKSMQKNQAGFTLIELVVVIVILGILAATALPKFFDLSKDARGGVMSGVESAMRSADTMLYAKAAAAGVSASATGTVKVNNVTINLAYGYAADATELFKVLTLSPVDDFEATTGTTLADPSYISHKKAADYLAAPPVKLTCSVKVTPASATAAPTYLTIKDGC